MTPIKAVTTQRNKAEKALNSAIFYYQGRLKLELMGHPADISAFSVWFPVQTRSIWRMAETEHCGQIEERLYVIC